MRYINFASPIGAITVGAQASAVEQIHIEGDRYFTQVPPHWVEASGRDPLLAQTKREILEYLEGSRNRFDFESKTHGTIFQERVWKALMTIPYGTTSTYAAIAEAIGAPGAVRAVGTAVGRNPICLAVPCHRVLSSSGGLGGYVAGIERKQQLLSIEGLKTLRSDSAKSLNQ